MFGGGIKNKLKETSKDNQLFFMTMGIFIILLKTMIVQWSYNKIWPKLTSNTGLNPSNFEPLTFYESFLFVILFEFLL